MKKFKLFAKAFKIHFIEVVLLIIFIHLVLVLIEWSLNVVMRHDLVLLDTFIANTR